VQPLLEVELVVQALAEVLLLEAEVLLLEEE
jgi:hypothetical protein